MHTAATEGSSGSKANGSLMRATPLGIWGYRLDANVLAQYARQDSALSHPNPSCGDAVACYVLAIARLLQVPGDRHKAFAYAMQWASTFANDEVKSWLLLAQEGRDIPYYPQAGFVKIAFVHAFRQLLLEASYEDALYETLLGGGDTDTNACIVGGLLGAACGAHAIPEDLKEPVLSCHTDYGMHPRPDWLCTTSLYELAKQLVVVGFFRE
jgi:ADP-ribosylglycohydrolase